MNTDTTCSLCGAFCTSFPLNYKSIQIFNCKYCGTFGENIAKLLDRDSREKAACLAYEMHLQGTDKYILTNSIVNPEKIEQYRTIYFRDFLKTYPNTIIKKANRALLNLSCLLKHKDEMISIRQKHEYACFFAANIMECVSVFSYLRSSGYVAGETRIILDGGGIGSINKLRITAEGEALIHEMTEFKKTYSADEGSESEAAENTPENNVPDKIDDNAGFPQSQ
ncbi:MAG: hypothetical protein ACYTFY_16710 [Planctomycetota bacterium]|jgi:hypothetical protein